MIDLTALTQAFHHHYPGIPEPPQIFFAPGRINLIGEHTDYNGGLVFPAAITFGTYGVVSPREDGLVRLFSHNFELVGEVTLDLQAPMHKADHEDWTVYVKGVIATLVAKGYTLTKGCDVYVQGNIPNGAGLSSSASLELLFVELLCALNDHSLAPIDKAKLAQQAEHWVGVNCGIMDQFAIAMGKAGHAIQLNTGTMAYTYAPVDLGAYQLLIMNTNKQRELAESKYNERRQECEQALALLDTSLPYLCSLTVDDFHNLNQGLAGSPILFRRAQHAITESHRVAQAAKVLEAGDLPAFGQLLNDSHASLKQDYEVTGNELDTIVALAQAQPGVLGARMTGAGFGGCALALVHGDQVAAVQDAVAKAYTQAIGYAPTFYTCTLGSGVGRVCP